MVPISLTVFFGQRLNIVADIFNLPAKTWGLGLNLLHSGCWLVQVQQVVSFMGAGQLNYTEINHNEIGYANKTR